MPTTAASYDGTLVLVAELVRPVDRRHPAAGPLAVVGDEQQRHVADRGARLDEPLDAAPGGDELAQVRLVGRCRRRAPRWSRCGPRHEPGDWCGIRCGNGRTNPCHQCARSAERRGEPRRQPGVDSAAKSARMGATRSGRGPAGGRTHVADADFDVLVLGAGSGGYACALRAAQLGSVGRPWSRRARSAAPASTSAASPPRRCCTPPRSPTRPASRSSSACAPRSTASTCPA